MRTSSPDNTISKVLALITRETSINLLQERDGVKNASALRAADIGVSIGITGSNVPKDATKIILMEDNSASISMLVAVKKVVKSVINSEIK